MSKQGQYLNNTYILHEELGSGAMGTVYRATHRLSGQVVALKRVNLSTQEDEEPDTADLTDDPTADLTGDASAVVTGTPDEPESAPGPGMNRALRVALAQEFRILASLYHPHIVRVIDYGFDEEQLPFYTMELLESPQTILEAGAGRPLVEKIDLLTQVLRALGYLHRRELLHRDIKPSNVRVERET